MTSQNVCYEKGQMLNVIFILCTDNDFCMEVYIKFELCQSEKN